MEPNSSPVSPQTPTPDQPSSVLPQAQTTPTQAPATSNLFAPNSGPFKPLKAKRTIPLVVFLVTTTLLLLALVSVGILYTKASSDNKKLNSQITDATQQLEEAKKTAEETKDSADNTDENNSTNDSTQLEAIEEKARNTERQTDIKSIHGQVEAYYAQNGRYPTLANMNDASFRSANMKGLDEEALKDPKGANNTLLAAAAANSYSYAVAATGGAACDNKTKDCAVYTLTATYEGGGTYAKSNLN